MKREIFGTLRPDLQGIDGPEMFVVCVLVVWTPRCQGI